MKYITQIARIIVSILFIISGLVKTIDPIGFGYKLEEYFAPDVFNIAFLHDLALPMAVFFSILEILLGIFLLLGIFKKFTQWSLLLLIIFFTFLTFYSAYFNKVTDCGCFGDALKLTPWQSFGKDIILLFLILILTFGKSHIKSLFSKKISYAIVFISLVGSVFIAYWGINHLPLKDFRAYAVGKNITEGMKTAEELGLESTKLQTIYTLINKDTKESVKITGDEYVNDDKWYKEGTPWEIDSDKTESVVLKKGYEAPIHDFELLCNDEDKTALYLEEPKLVFYIIPFVEKLTPTQIKTLNSLTKNLETNNIKVIAGVNNPIENTIFEQCFVDQITLKTIVRSNPGVVLLNKGTVIAKYHYNDLPSAEEIENNF